MKKIISKIALLGVSMAAIFSSCVVDDIQTSFDLAEAQCKVNVTVVYALDQSDITSQSTITSKYGNTSTFFVDTKNKTVEAEALTITAQFKGLTETQTLNIATLLPGGVAEYNVKFVFGGAGDLKYTEVEAATADVAKVSWLTNSHYSHAGETDNWLYNDTEFILTGDVEYDIWKGTTILSIDPASDANVKSFADARATTDPVVKTTDILPITVSGWARYRVYATLTTTTKTFDVYENNTLLGTSKKIGSYTCKIYSSNAAQYKEEANPGHSAHYHYGHGHDSHGAHNNAGGGIIFGE